jgi:hypothetical protein
MNTLHVVNELNRNKSVFLDLLENLDGKLIHWKQSDAKWSLLEIICHLCDEEKEDFRARLIITLEDPKKEFKPIDPVGWVASRKYSEENFDIKLNQFITEREKSIEFLRTLNQPMWDNYYEHPKFGNLSAKMFFTNWLAHDYLHIRQIIKLKFDYLSITSNEKLDYAGDW